MRDNFVIAETVFSVFRNIRMIIEHSFALIFGIPKCVSECVIRVFEVRATLTEDIEAPDMIIIQDYLGTIQEENEESLGSNPVSLLKI